VTQADVLQGYLTAWKAGCKGTTVYRDRCRVHQVLNVEEATAEEATNEACLLRGDGTCG
jgi:ribonucleoside-diphosphate reductase alpha chain